MTSREVACPAAEVALLGCLLRLPASRVIDIARLLTAQDFADPRNRAVLAGTAMVAARGEDPDPPLVLGELRRLGIETSFACDLPAAMYLGEVYSAAGVPANADAYLRVVLEHAYRRRVVGASERLHAEAGVLALVDLRALVDAEVGAVRSAQSRLESAGTFRVRATA